MPEVVNLSELWRGRARDYHRLFTRISFEARSIEISRCLPKERSPKVIAFISSSRSDLAERNLISLRDRHKYMDVHELEANNPLATGAKLAEVFGSAIRSRTRQRILIDITAFRREELLIISSILLNSDIPDTAEIDLLYLEAATMSSELSDTVVGLRSVLGFSGSMRPGRKTLLVLLTGFETNCARSIIEGYEPNEVLIGIGSRDGSISQTLYEKNVEFSEEIRRLSFGFGRTFEFSPRDPLSVLTELESAIDISRDINVIIAPLNTKLSTLGVGLYAFKHPEVQVCYAPVDHYNELDYSQPGTRVHIVRFADILQSNSMHRGRAGR